MCVFLKFIGEEKGWGRGRRKERIGGRTEGRRELKFRFTYL